MDKLLKDFLLRVWNESHKTSIFDSLSYSFLVFHAISIVISWNNLEILSCIFAQNCKIFVINLVQLINAALAFSSFITWHKFLIINIDIRFANVSLALARQHSLCSRFLEYVFAFHWWFGTLIFRYKIRRSSRLAMLARSLAFSGSLFQHNHIL